MNHLREDLRADDSHEISSLNFLKLKKYATHLLSAAVKIDALRVNNLCFVTIKRGKVIFVSYEFYGNFCKL